MSMVLKMALSFHSKTGKAKKYRTESVRRFNLDICKLNISVQIPATLLSRISAKTRENKTNH